ncbi:carbohydrate esterase family 16 protein [Plicaturopsis crispa FD-325 SS-3]|nr:carbohydrate esterase family 16 protein [Plicaturopsis crispa FD-325 SS-3]
MARLSALCAGLFLLLSATARARSLDARQGSNDGIHLAVSPKCGPLAGNVTDVNAGLNLNAYKTIVSFGDSYTDGGIQNGSALRPPVLTPPSSLAGNRSTNGPVWIEGIASDIGARLMDYAVPGACTDLSLWPSNPTRVDFLGQVNTFVTQDNKLDPNTTLYTIFFGINDYEASKIDGDHMPQAAQAILNQISILSSAPTNARAFLITDVYGRGAHSAAGEAYKQSIFDGLHAFHTNASRLDVAFADFARIWDGVLDGPPGYEAFGYTSTDNCVQGATIDPECDDPEHYFYWIPRHPSKETHRIMADYVEEVLSSCVVP